MSAFQAGSVGVWSMLCVGDRWSSTHVTSIHKRSYPLSRTWGLLCLTWSQDASDLWQQNQLICQNAHRFLCLWVWEDSCSNINFKDKIMLAKKPTNILPKQNSIFVFAWMSNKVQMWQIDAKRFLPCLSCSHAWSQILSKLHRLSRPSH